MVKKGLLKIYYSIKKIKKKLANKQCIQNSGNKLKACKNPSKFYFQKKKAESHAHSQLVVVQLVVFPSPSPKSCHSLENNNFATMNL